MKFYLQFLCVTGCLKHSNDTPKLNIHKYTNYNMMKIYINRSSTTTGLIFLLFLCRTKNLIIQWALENVLIEICDEFNIYYSGIGAS